MLKKSMLLVMAALTINNAQSLEQAEVSLNVNPLQLLSIGNELARIRGLLDTVNARTCDLKYIKQAVKDLTREYDFTIKNKVFDYLVK